jgi:hypothetical protein
VFKWRIAVPVQCVSVALPLLIILALSAKHRDLTNYDVSPPCVLGSIPDSPEVTELTTKCREFVWMHWHEHRRGFIVVTTFGKEGSRSALDRKYYIEPDESGRWVINARQRLRNSPHDARDYTITRVIRIPIDRSNSSTLDVVIPDDAVASPKSFELRFRDEN